MSQIHKTGTVNIEFILFKQQFMQQVEANNLRWMLTHAHTVFQISYCFLVIFLHSLIFFKGRDILCYHVLQHCRVHLHTLVFKQKLELFLKIEDIVVGE